VKGLQKYLQILLTCLVKRAYNQTMPETVF